MWLYRTGNDWKTSAILYDYPPSRNSSYAVTYLKDFKGYVHFDDYSGCNELSGITRVGYWTRLRRNFVEAIPGKKAEGARRTSAEIRRDYCNQLFRIEDSLKELSPEKRYEKRLEPEKPVFEAFGC